MRRFNGLLFLALIICGILGCSKGNNNVSPNAQRLIIGTWSLQQEHIVQYIDAVKEIDTTYLTASNNKAQIKFNNDGSYASVSSFYSVSPLGPVAASATAGGTYKFTGQDFSLSEGVSGFGHVIGFYQSTTATSAEVPVVAPVSHSAQIKHITKSVLDLHTEVIYNVTVNGVLENYKVEEDYSYTK
jgi:hypothetical protein